MLLETIVSGIGIVIDVTRILKESERNRVNRELRNAIRRTEARVAALQAEIARPADQRNEERLRELYEALLRTVAVAKHYRTRLEVVPTDKGRLRLIVRRRRARKNVILRDAEGEYCAPAVS